MRFRFRVLRKPWVLVALMFTLLTMTLYKKNDTHLIHSKSSIPLRLYQGSKDKFSNHSLNVHADRWIVMDGTHISSDDLSDLNDVPNWRILVFGKHIQRPKDRRCINCMFINDPSAIHVNQPLSVTDLKVASYSHAITHGAKWIYVTNKVSSLKEQIEGFHFDPTIKGLLYNGQLVFNPDVHFGAQGMVNDRNERDQLSSYYLGKYKTPSVQKIWRVTKSLQGSAADINSLACRLPRAIVPPHLFPSRDLMGSLIEHRSFWALGSLLSNKTFPAMASWWLWLMRDIKETLGIHPPSCSAVSTLIETGDQYTRQERETSLSTLTCDSEHTFFTCAILLAEEMATRGILLQSDVLLLKIWFDSLGLINYPEPIRNRATNGEYRKGPIHKVIFEPQAMAYHPTELENPFSPICKSKLPIQNLAAVPAIHDILLIVIFNFPTYYSNIQYLDYIYRKFFTNILYCGSSLSNLSDFKSNFSRPLNFLEVREIDKGLYGYMCLTYAMEMDLKVSGYLQVSDDVLLNMWNLGSLPRDKIWFQHRIRKASLHNSTVMNIAQSMTQKLWSPWGSKTLGVTRLREMWVHFEELRETPDESKVVQFLKQLKTSYGGYHGAFYEASDIFYLPNKYKEDFIFLSNICFDNHLFLEIAIPTILCGLDNINNIVRLNGTYLWYDERPSYSPVYNPEHIFLHPWKVKDLIGNVNDTDFLCTRYLPYIEGKSFIKLPQAIIA